VHCSRKKCGCAVNLNSHEAAKPPETGAAPARRKQYLKDGSQPALALRHRPAPAAEGRMRLRRVQSRGFETGQDRPRVHPPAL